MRKLFKDYNTRIISIILTLLPLTIISCMPLGEIKFYINDSTLDVKGDVITAGFVRDNNKDSIIIHPLSGNEFTVVYIGETSDAVSNGIAVNSSGDVFLTGNLAGKSIGTYLTNNNYNSRSSNNLSNDIFLLKYNSLMTYKWSFLIGGSGYDIGTDIEIDRDDNIYIAGNFSETVDFNPDIAIEEHQSGGNLDSFLCKFDSSGVFIWVETFGGPQDVLSNSIYIDESVQTTDSQTYVISGGSFEGVTNVSKTISFNSNGGSDCYVSKYDSDGNLIWSKAWGGIGNDSVKSINGDINGNIYIAGNFESDVDFNPGQDIDLHQSNGEEDAFITVLDSDGNYKYTRTFGGNSTDLAYDIAVDTVGNIYTVGSFIGLVDFDPTTASDDLDAGELCDPYVAKYNTNGAYQWSFSIQAIDQMVFTTITIIKDNEIFAAGNSESTQYHVRFDSDGNILYEGEPYKK